MEYKFRGKRKDNGDWVVGDIWANRTLPDDPLVRISTWKNIDGVPVNYEYTVMPETVGQFTGLKDKYGQELYEGDIYQPVHCTTQRYKIMFISGAFVGGKSEEHCLPIGWDDNEEGTAAWLCKIGNIHDHPHLLNPLQRSSVTNTMTDPNVKAAEQEATGAAESAAQDTAMEATETTESAEEGSVEG